jgi:hypothetical protein
MTNENNIREYRELAEYYLEFYKGMNVGISEDSVKSLAGIVLDMINISSEKDPKKRGDSLKEIAQRIQIQLYPRAYMDGAREAIKLRLK